MIPSQRLRYILLLLALVVLGGCQDSGNKITFSNHVSSDYEMRDSGDGWIYVSDVTHGTDWIRFRINGKHTTWDDFEVEDLERRDSK